MKERYNGHLEAVQKGGRTQSQKIHYCELCDQFGRGNKFLGFHIKSRRCEGRGVVNYYARLMNEIVTKLF